MTNMTSQSNTSEQESGSEQESSGFADKLAKRTSDATSQTVERLQQARERLDNRLAEQRSNIVQRVRGVSRVLAGGGTMLGDDDEIGAHGLHYASEKLDRVAAYLEEVELSSITDDLRGLARDRPAWFFGSAFTLGLVLGRFAHSTAATVGGANSSDEQAKTPSTGDPRPAPAKQVASRRPAVSARAEGGASGGGSAGSGGPRGSQDQGSPRPGGRTSGHS